MSRLRLLSGGAAQGLVAGVAAKFQAATGRTIDGEFGAVGTLAARLRGGTAADVVILTAALVGELGAQGLLAAGSIRTIGLVETAVAVRARDTPPRVTDADSLRQVLRAADAIFVPDISASTAGIHVMKVLNQLGIADEVRARLKIFPNGATAMRNLAASDARTPIGCTQSTEIIATPGLKLAGTLPDALALKTIYCGAVTARATDQAIAGIFVELLVDREQLPLRQKAGFLEIGATLASSLCNI